MNMFFDLALKSSIILGAALLGQPFLRRQSAALRHSVWLVTLIGLAALPILSAALPGWNLLPTWKVSTPAPTPTAPAMPRVSSAGSVATRPEFSRAVTAEPTIKSSKVSYARWTEMIWLGGALIVLTPLALAWASLAWLERRSMIVKDEAWLDMVEGAARRLGIQQPVLLLMSADRQMPMAWGVLRPRVLLPAEARQWPEQRLESALLHELAHVKRSDSIVNYIAHAVCALYWFNPLAWLAFRRMRLEREQACDDLVLTSGIEAGDYADELLEMASSLTPNAFAMAAASPMARRSTLEERLLAILDNDRNRSAANPRKMAGVTALLAAILVPIATLHPASAKAQDAKEVPAATTATAGSELDFAKSFAVSPGGALTMDLEDGDVEITSGDDAKVEISVHRRITHANEKEAKELLENHEITFGQNGSDVSVHSKQLKQKSSGWFGAQPNLSVEYKITTPRKYNFTLSTGGGNITIEDKEGKVHAQTGGGNLELNHIDGAVWGRTGGGDIAASGCEALDVESGGGNLKLHDLSGDTRAHTGGGGAKIVNCAGKLEVKSGGGDLTIDNFTGSSLQADTGGGSITADIVNPFKEKCVFGSGGGNIRIKAPADLAVNLDAATDGGSVKCDLPLTSTSVKSDDHIKGAINGGGPELNAHSGGGDIKISKR
jgi:beta-lactamase regulating signal transducer with metallopeptidase domain/DUF4097 and DUF4098 domain-containing protein YvlB